MASKIIWEYNWVVFHPRCFEAFWAKTPLDPFHHPSKGQFLPVLRGISLDLRMIPLRKEKSAKNKKIFSEMMVKNGDKSNLAGG